MRHLILAVLLCFGPTLGCAGSAEKYADHAWQYRETLIYAHAKLTDDQKRGEIYAAGAALGMSPAVIEKDLAEHGLGE